MAPKKQPLRLMDLSARAIAGSVVDTAHKFEELTKRVEEMSAEACLKVFLDLHNNIMKVPPELADMITTHALMEVNMLVSECDCVRYEGNTRAHRLCVYKMENLIKSCIHVNVRNLDFNTWPKFMWLPLCSNLHRMSELEDLCLPTNVSLPKEKLNLLATIVEDNIYHLRNLRGFTFPQLCTDKLIKRLSRWCTKLVHLNISTSKSVTDSSIPYILKLMSLRHLYIVNTKISDEGLVKLFSSQQELRTLRYHCSFGTVLKKEATKSLPHLETIHICFSTPLELVVNKCQNLREITIQEINEDLSGLGELPQLQSLVIWLVDVEQANLEGLLTRKGRDLTSLELIQSVNVDLVPIMMRCSTLKRLSLVFCFVKDWAPMDCLKRSLPHFQSLEILEIKPRHKTKPKLWWILEKYRNIEVIDVANVTEIDNDSVLRALYYRGLMQLREFKVFNCGNMDMVTLHQLLENCIKLEKVAGLKTWSGLSQKDMAFCNILIQRTNLAVQLDWADCSIMELPHFLPEN